MKAYARANPTAWENGRPTPTAVSSMTDGDFFSHEQSVTIAEAAKCTSRSPTNLETPPSCVHRLRWKPVKWWTLLYVQGFVDFLLAEASRLCQRQRSAVLAAHESHHDEGLGPDHLWARRSCVVRPLLKSTARHLPPGVNPNNGFGDAISKMQGHADEAAFTADEYLSGIAMVVDRGIPTTSPLRCHHRRLDARHAA